LNNSYILRTISTFSSDIAYAVSLGRVLLFVQSSSCVGRRFGGLSARVASADWPFGCLGISVKSVKRMDGDLNLKLAAAVDAPRRAREVITAQVGSRLSTARRSALLTIVSELVANSVKHGPGRPIQVNLKVSKDGAVLGRVEDGGQGRVAVREGVNPTEGGVGLKVVDAFTDRWGVEEGTSNVWFELAPSRFGRHAFRT
jgi:anti-sigma regulatory factor (Ser/Thr protein kinase)